MSGVDCVVIGPKQTGAEERSLMRTSHPACQSVDRLNFVRHRGREYLPLDLLSLLRDGRTELDTEADFRGSYLTVNEIPALAPLVLATHLTKAGFDTEVVHFFDAEKPRLQELVRKGRPVVAITTTLYTDPTPIRGIVRTVRRANPEATIVVGGPYVLNRWNRGREAALLEDASFVGADYYVVGAAGEEALEAIVRDPAGAAECGVAGLGWVKEGRLLLTPPPALPGPLPGCGVDWSMFDSEVLGTTVNFRTGRGCAFACAYCNYPILAGRISLAELSVIESELAQIAAHGCVRYVAFIDDTFNIPAKRFRELCKMLCRNDFGFQWVSYLRVGGIDEETVRLMRSSGCVGVFLGLESGDDVVLANMNKKSTVDEYRRGIELLKKHGIIAFGTFISGFPGETEESLRRTGDFIREVELDYYRFGLWFADPSTPVFEQRERFGIEGTGYAWRHATMDSVTAADAIWSTFFVDDRNPAWLTEHVGFWGLTYLLGKGFSRADIDHLLQKTRQFMLANADPSAAARQVEERLAGELAKLARRVPYDTQRSLPRGGAGLGLRASAGESQ